MKITSALALGMVLVTACSMSSAQNQELTAQEPIFVTSSAARNVTANPIVETTVTPSATPATNAAFVPFQVTTWADNVLLRKNPGYLFAKLEALKKNSSLLVLGKSLGGEWLLVQTNDNRSGWVFLQLIETMGRPLDNVPVVAPSDVLLITGHVSDDSGKPISGVQFALVQGGGSSAPRNDAMTDGTGTFYAFMPPDATGTWWLSYAAIACTSNIMDANCNWQGQPDPKGMNITLPPDAHTVFEFKWR